MDSGVASSRGSQHAHSRGCARRCRPVCADAVTAAKYDALGVGSACRAGIVLSQESAATCPKLTWSAAGLLFLSAVAYCERCGEPYQAEHQPANFCECVKATFCCNAPAPAPAPAPSLSLSLRISLRISPFLSLSSPSLSIPLFLSLTLSPSLRFSLSLSPSLSPSVFFFSLSLSPSLSPSASLSLSLTLSLSPPLSLSLSLALSLCLSLAMYFSEGPLSRLHRGAAHRVGTQRATGHGRVPTLHVWL